jgi:hypothetical protein
MGRGGIIVTGIHLVNAVAVPEEAPYNLEFVRVSMEPAEE